MTKPWREFHKLPREVEQGLNPLNDLSGSEWSQASLSVKEYGGYIASKRRAHGAAFPLSLAKDLIQIFTRAGDTVLDPFVGVGTTADAAQLTGRHAIGFDISPEFIRLAQNGIDDSDRTPLDFKASVRVELFNESCERLRRHVADASVDLVLTSPPYCNLLNVTTGRFASSTYGRNIYRGKGRILAKPYTSLPEDFGNLDFPKYSQKIRRLMEALLAVAKPGSYNVWVVRDFRDMENGVPYLNLHSRIVELGCAAGWILTDIVIWDQTRQRHLVKLGGQRKRRFYFNIGHSFLVVFRKNLAEERFRNA